MSALYDLMFLNTSTTLISQANGGATSINMSTTGIVAEQGITIVLDDASTHVSTVASITDATHLVIVNAIPAARHADLGAAAKSYYAFMCRQHEQIKDFKVTDSPLLPEIVITGEASYESISPEKEIRLIQGDWRKGFQNFILEDAYTYYDSENCDARMKGIVTLSPKKLSALSFSGSPTVKYFWNANLDEGSFSVMGWVAGSAYETVGLETTNYRSSPNAIVIDSLTDHNTAEAYMTLPWKDSFKGQQFTFTAYQKAGSTEDTKIGIYDGIDTTWCTEVAGTSAWVQLSVVKTLSASATCLRIHIYSHDNRGGTYTTTSYWDDLAISSTALAGSLGEIVEPLEFGSDIVGASGSILFKISGGSLVEVVDFITPITDLCVFGTRLFIALGWTTGWNYWYTSDLTTFTKCDLSNSTAKYMSNVGESQFWIADTTYTMRDSSNPINGGTAFSTPYTVGGSAFSITGLVDHSEVVFCRKQDDVYYLSAGSVISLLSLKTEATTTYSHKLYCWGDYLFIPSDLNSLYLYEVTTGSAMVISPTRYAVGDTNYDGQVTAMCFDATYAYAALENGSNVRILSGRFENVAGDTDWYWHPIYSLTSNDIKAMLISSLTGYKRLYAGTDTYSDGLIPFWISTSYSQPYTESGFECQTAGTFITPWLTTNFPTDLKTWTSVDITSICKSADATSITPYYQVKGGSWVAMSACTQSAGAGYPVEVTDNRTIGISSERIRFKFEMAATVDEYTPILYGLGGYGIVAHAVLQTDRKRQIEAVLVIASQVNNRSRLTRNRVIATDLANLRSLYTGGNQLTVVAPDETSYNVTFAREGYEEQLAYDDTIRNEVWWCTVRLLEA